MINVTFGGFLWASHPNVEKLMIHVTYGRPLQARHPKVEQINKYDPWWTLAAKTSTGRKFINQMPALVDPCEQDIQR